MGDLETVGADPRILAHQIVEQVVAEFDARRTERDEERIELDHGPRDHGPRDAAGMTSPVAPGASTDSMDAPLFSGSDPDVGSQPPTAVQPAPSEPVKATTGDTRGATGTAVRARPVGTGSVAPAQRTFERLRRAQSVQHTLHHLRGADLARRGRRWVGEADDLARGALRRVREADLPGRGLHWVRRIREADAPRRGLRWIRETDLPRRGLRRIRGAEPGRVLEREGVRWVLVLAIGASLFTILLVLLIETLSGLLTF